MKPNSALVLFLFSLITHPDKSNLGEKRICCFPVPGLRLPLWEAEWWEPEAAIHTTSILENREQHMDVSLPGLSSLSPFPSGQGAAQGIDCGAPLLN